MQIWLQILLNILIQNNAMILFFFLIFVVHLVSVLNHLQLLFPSLSLSASYLSMLFPPPSLSAPPYTLALTVTAMPQFVMCQRQPLKKHFLWHSTTTGKHVRGKGNGGILIHILGDTVKLMVFLALAHFGAEKRKLRKVLLPPDML